MSRRSERRLHKARGAQDDQHPVVIADDLQDAMQYCRDHDIPLTQAASESPDVRRRVKATKAKVIRLDR